MKKTILVVDDDRDILDAMELLLEDAGYYVVKSEKGEAAEALAKNGHTLPQLLILDMFLSGKDGRTIAQFLKSQDKTKALPILMMSAHPNAADSVKQTGADAFLPKPFDIDELLDMIRTYVA